MTASLTDKQKLRHLVRTTIAKTTQACVRRGHEMGLGQASLNLIVASELIKLGSAFAIRLGADEEGVARLARGCYSDAQGLARALPAGLFLASAGVERLTSEE